MWLNKSFKLALSIYKVKSMIITLATWNLDQFQHPSETPLNFRKRIYPKKIDYIENTIVNKLNLPDIIAFQEILGETQINENTETGTGAQRDIPKCLIDIGDRLKAHAPYNFYFSNYRSRGIRVALFTKLQICKLENGSEDMEICDTLGPESHLSFPWAALDTSDSRRIKVFEFGENQAWYENRRVFTRPQMCVRLTMENNVNFQVFIAHLKSKKPRYDFEQVYPNINGTNRTRRTTSKDTVEEARGKMRSLIIRTRESCQLRNFISTRLNKYPMDNAIVLGDLNDNLESVTTQMLEGITENSNNKTIKTEDNYQQVLFNLSSLIEPEKRFSLIYKNIREQHDHILVSKTIISKSPSSYTEGNGCMTIFNEDIQKKIIVPDGFEHVPNHAPVLGKLEI